jgi:CO dehydrogenase maturation factor
MDMEAGIEHLGRATAQSVDKLIVVVEPGRRSIDTARNIQRLASEIHLSKVALVGNKIRSDKDRAFLEKHLADLDIMGFLPYDDQLIEADLEDRAPYETDSPAVKQVQAMIAGL